MKVVPLSEAKARPSHFGRMCRREPVVVTVNGRPSSRFSPIDEQDDLIDTVLAENPGFRRLLEARLKEPAIPAAQAARRLGAGRKSAARPQMSR
jgi:antitoxin (DNA-binding transcriptional repressor) of toxin-antitoxin stability system